MKTETTHPRRSQAFSWLAALLLGLFVVQIIGCTDMSMPEGSPAMKQQALSFSPAPGKAGVYVIHTVQILFGEYGIAGTTANDEDNQINLDYQEFGQVSFNSYLYGMVPPGEHTLNSGSGNSNSKVVHFTAEPGKNYYFNVAGDVIVPISETNGQTLVRQSKLSGDNRFEYQNPPGLTK
jgi:hypothetical protein